MDPVVLLDSITRLIKLSSKVLSRIKEFSGNEGFDESPPECFTQILVKLPAITRGFETILSDLEEPHGDDAGLVKSRRADLGPLVGSALRDVEELHDLLGRVVPPAGASSFQKGIKALRSLFNDDKVKAISDRLNDCMTTLTFYYNVTNSRSESKPQWPEPLWLVPYDRQEFFVGREDIFEQIATRFANSRVSQPRVALYGLGGIGKSQIALEYCYRRWHRADRCSVFWVNAATPARFEESLRRIARGVLVTKDDSGLEAMSLLKDWLETQHKEPWLMVVDNVDDKDAFFEKDHILGGKSCSEYIPSCRHGSLLFTTRNSQVAVDLTKGLSGIDVKEISRNAGLELFKSRLNVEYSDEEMTELLEVLEYIPLAITQALSLIIKKRWTISNYLEQYRKSDMAKTRLLSHEFSDHARSSGTLESVTKTWMLSFDLINDDNPEAAQILCFASFLQNQSVPISLLKRGFFLNRGLRVSSGQKEEDTDDFEEMADELEEAEDELEEAIDCLRGFSFIDVFEESCRMHRLVQLATKQWLKQQGPSVVARWALTALQCLIQEFPDWTSSHKPDYMRTCEPLVPHIEAILTFAQGLKTKEVEEAEARLLFTFAHYLTSVGNYSQAQSRSRLSFTLNSKHRGEKHIETIESASQLGWILSVWEDDEESIPILEKALKDKMEVLGQDDPATIDCLTDLAAAIRLTGDLERSENMQREAYQRSLKVLGPEHMFTLNSAFHLADILDTMGRYAEAEKVQREVYVTEKALGISQHELLITQLNLAMMIANAQGFTEEAEALFASCLAKSKELRGVDHRETLAVVYQYAHALSEAEKNAEALELCNQTLKEARDGPRRDNVHSQRFMRDIMKLRETVLGEMSGDGRDG